MTQIKSRSPGLLETRAKTEHKEPPDTPLPASKTLGFWELFGSKKTNKQTPGEIKISSVASKIQF